MCKKIFIINIATSKPNIVFDLKYNLYKINQKIKINKEKYINHPSVNCWTNQLSGI